MKILKLLSALLLCAATASAQVEFRDDGRVWIRGERRDDTVWMRSCFKLANHLTYHFTGQGGGHYGLGSAREVVDEYIAQGWDGCRPLLETEGWSECESGAEANDGKPDNCMFGSEPVDKGAWNVDALRRGGRPTEMHGVARNALRWFFEVSQETGFIFEVVAIATLKHNDVPVAQQTHVIRQTNAEARRLQEEFPRANVVINAINEWNAHSRWTLGEVNMLAVRADRCKHPDGRTAVTHECPPGFEPEQWPGGPFIVDAGGGDTFDFDVGPEPGKFDLGAVHPERDDTWSEFPADAELARLVRDSRGQPWGITEFMYFCEPGEVARRARGGACADWYGAGGWTSDWSRMLSNLRRLKEVRAPYVVAHDECGVASVLGWPVAECHFDRWAREHLADHGPPPEPEPEPTLRYDRLIEHGYQVVLERSADPSGLAAYNEWFRECYAYYDELDEPRNCMAPFLDVLAASEEFRRKNTR